MKIENIFSVKDKIVLITGGSRGIGEMIASGFVANGAKVYITARSKEVLTETAEKLSNKYKGKCIAIPSDLSNLKGIEIFAEEIQSKEKSLDVLINNAGAAWGGSFEEFPEVGWDKVMDLNLKSLFFLTQSLVPMLKESANKDDPSRIINIGSIDGINKNTFKHYSYSASKSAVHHLSKVLAAELVKKNINVNVIAPGPFPSNMLGKAVSFDYSELEKRNPRGRVGTPEDIAGLAIFLASRAGAFTVGEVITCDGGLVAVAGHDLTS